jgi:hypothetical protein
LARRKSNQDTKVLARYGIDDEPTPRRSASAWQLGA